MIVLILKIIFLTVLFSLGWKVSISDGMWLEKIGWYAERKVNDGHKIWDAIWCEWCSPNLMGILFVWPLGFMIEVIPTGLEWYKYIGIYIFTLTASSFISGFLWNLYLTLNAIRDYYKGDN